MTAEQWVSTILGAKVGAHPTLGQVIRLSPQEVVPVATFCTLFRTVLEDTTKPDKYTPLCGIHTFQWATPAQAVTHTATELGYKPAFDQWKTEGLIA